MNYDEEMAVFDDIMAACGCGGREKLEGGEIERYVI